MLSDVFQEQEQDEASLDKMSRNMYVDGYRTGKQVGTDTGLQNSFDKGFESGLRWGKLCGKTCASALTSEQVTKAIFLLSKISSREEKENLMLELSVIASHFNSDTAIEFDFELRKRLYLTDENMDH